MLRRLSLVLPDSREFDVSVQITDTGAVYDEHGEWRDDDGRAYADISGDFRLHLAARGVVDCIDLPYERADLSRRPPLPMSSASARS